LTVAVVVAVVAHLADMATLEEGAVEEGLLEEVSGVVPHEEVSEVVVEVVVNQEVFSNQATLILMLA
jgi:predicted transcriptional regulator